MTTKINKKIVGYKVKTTDELPHTNKSEETVKIDLESVHEKLKRPDELIGATYKIKTVGCEHALYITINDIILNKDTQYEERKPYEIFINSKNMEHFQWVLALTRVISGVFRKGGDLIFLVDELKAVFDPKGGYFKKGGVFMPSLVAEIGYVIEKHMKKIGMIEDQLDTHQKQYLLQKRREFEEKTNSKDNNTFPEQAVLCNKCNVKAMILMDGCMTCLNCGDSKCG